MVAVVMIWQLMTFSFSICNPVHEQEFDLCTLPGNMIQVGTEVYTSPGFYETIIDIPNTCHDSIVYTTLTGEGLVNTEEYFLICPGDSMNIAGTFYASDTIIIDTLSPVGECLEITTYTLEVGLPRTFEQGYLCAGDSLFISGSWVTTSGIFQDTFLSVMGCDSIHTIDLLFHDFYIESNFPTGTVDPGQLFQLSVNSNSIDGALYQWSPPEFFSCTTCEDPLFVPIQSGNYSVTGYDPVSGCTDTLQFYLAIEPCRDSYIPNAFSPNYDGLNDQFQPFLSNCVVNISTFQIFDRWGNAVHVQHNIPVEAAIWDGRFRSKEAPVGVYAYFLKAELFDGRMLLFKGDVTLLR